MKRKLTILGLILFLSFSARASIIADVHNKGRYVFYADTDSVLAYGNNLVFYKVPYWLEGFLRGYAVVFYDMAFSTVKIITFGYIGDELDNLMIEAYWPDLNRSVSGVAVFQDLGLESATLQFNSPNAQGSDRPAPARTERSGDGLLLPDHDPISVIPEKSGLQSFEYNYRLKGIIPGTLLTYYFYVYDQLYYSPEAEYACYSLLAELHYLGVPWRTTDGLLFVRQWFAGATGYMALYITLFQNSVLKSRSLTDQIFTSGANNMYMISPEGSYGEMQLTLE